MMVYERFQEAASQALEYCSLMGHKFYLLLLWL